MKISLAPLLTGFLALMFSGGLAHAHENDIANDKESTSFELVYRDLGAFVSTPQESKTQFLARVGTYLAHYTRYTGWEACGQIMAKDDGSGWAVNLLTNGSQVACTQLTYAMEGYVDTREGIHSHPVKSSVRLTRQDIRLRASGLCGSHMRVFSNAFSAEDFEIGPGYLVVGSQMKPQARLLYQAGVGTQEKVADLDESQPGAPDRTTLGVAQVKEGVKLVSSELGREEIQWGVRTCNTF